MNALPVAERTGMPIEDFIRLYEQEGPFELIDGERCPKLAGVAEHATLIKLFYDILRETEKTYGTIELHRETTYVLEYSPNWVTGSRVPDLMVYDSAHMAAYIADTPNWKDLPYVLVPDLCIEVISPTDSYEAVDGKVERYLADGVRLVWVVNPRHRTIHVYSGESNISVRLTIRDTLDGGTVIPDFSLPLCEIFKG
jgi:Uma2 family endonuclease